MTDRLIRFLEDWRDRVEARQKELLERPEPLQPLRPRRLAGAICYFVGILSAIFALLVLVGTIFDPALADSNLLLVALIGNLGWVVGVVLIADWSTFPPLRNRNRQGGDS